jgi:unsaturated rhamnogalacturonyl hydrolase
MPSQRRLNLLIAIIVIFANMIFTNHGFTQSDINYTLPTPDEVKSILGRVKDHLELVTPYRFHNRKTNEVITDFSAPQDVYAARLPGRHSIWSYEMGVAYAGMISCTQVTGDSSYLAYAEKTFKFIIDHLNYIRATNDKFGDQGDRFARVIRPSHLDHCGAMGAAMIKLQTVRPDKRYRQVIDLIADWISNKQVRLKDGTLARPGDGPWEFTLWTDDLYMSVPFLAQMGKLTGNAKYYDDAVKQILNFSKYLFDDQKRLFDHAWFSHARYNPKFFWGRQNGWAIMAMAELLSVLPENYPGREKVLDIYRQNVYALTELQSPNGLWHQLLDKEETYLETSCTAMFAFAIARGVNRGWIEAIYAPVAQAAWRAVEKQVTEDGQIAGVCRGTSVGYNAVYYANRPQLLLAYHGYGPVFLAGAEMIELNNNFEIKGGGDLFHYFPKPSK